VKDIHDVITQAKFGDDRLRGSGLVAGQISAFPIDFAGRPYNTLTLPCERVICNQYPCIYLHRVSETRRAPSDHNLRYSLQRGPKNWATDTSPQFC